MKAPCKGCERRKLLCHSVCEEYKAFVAENEEIKKKRQMIDDTYPKWKTETKNGRNGKEVTWFRHKK